MRLDPSFDDGHAGSRALGLIVLRTDETLEVETRGVFAAANVACYHARIPSHADVTPQTLAQMAVDLPATADLLPSGVPFGAIGYGCTSGATIIGPENVAAAIRRSHKSAKVTDPITAVMAALRALDVRRIGVLTPYVPEVTGEMHRFLSQNEFEIARVASFSQVEDRKIARISERATLAAISEIGAAPDCEAVFVSCTNLRTFGILKEAERRLKKPVISSNQALSWHMLRLASVARRNTGPGCLFDH